MKQVDFEKYQKVNLSAFIDREKLSGIANIKKRNIGQISSYI
jgi:hypothetical protein